MKLRSLFALSCCLALMGPAMAKAQDTFNFDSISNAGNPFLSTVSLPLTSGSSSITSFTPTSSGGDGIAFQFQDAGNYGSNQSGTVLVDASGLPGDTLTVNFAPGITSFALDYAITPFGTPSFTLDGVSYSGVLNAISGELEGTASTTFASPVSSVLLTFGGGTTFALDNFRVTSAPVPEPGTVAFALAMGLPAAWQLRRKLARK